MPIPGSASSTSTNTSTVNDNGITSVNADNIIKTYTYTKSIYTDYCNGNKGATINLWPKSFYNVEGPQNPIILIDFMIEGSWVPIQLKQNNFFKTLQIEDAGGTQKFSLTLNDKEIYNLEYLVSRTIAYTQAKTSSDSASTASSKTYQSSATIKTASLSSDENNVIYNKKYNVINKWFKPTTPAIDKSNIDSWMSFLEKLCGDMLNFTVSAAKLGLDSKNNLNSIIKAFKNIYLINSSNPSSPYVYWTSNQAIVTTFLNKIMPNSCSNGDFSYVEDYKNKMVSSVQSDINDVTTTENSLLSSKQQTADQTNEGNNLITIVESFSSLTSNLRIRFGHSDSNLKNHSGEFKYTEFQDSNSSVEATNTTKTSKGKLTNFGARIYTAGAGNVKTTPTVIRSPWYYFLITGVQSKVSSDGLSYTLTGFSVSSMRLDKFKMVQKFAKIKGTPKNLLADLMNTFNTKLKDFNNPNGESLSSLKLWIAPDTNIKETTQTDKSTGKQVPDEVEISLGSEASCGRINSYMSLRSLFTEFCSLCPRLEPDDVSVTEIHSYENGVDVVSEQKKATNSYPLSFTVIEENGVSNVIFYYKKPAKYPAIRVYDWGFVRNSIVKELEINNKNEFAALASFSLYDVSSQKIKRAEITASSGYGNNTSKDSKNKSTLTYLANSVSEFYTPDGRLAVKNAIIQSLTESLYEGTITVPGDPFYMFDEAMAPYSYPIRINVWVPDGTYTGNNTATNNYVMEGAIPSNIKKSYISGVYVVTNITHNISNSGFTTTLGVMKFPGSDSSIS